MQVIQFLRLEFLHIILRLRSHLSIASLTTFREFTWEIFISLVDFASWFNLWSIAETSEKRRSRGAKKKLRASTPFDDEEISDQITSCRLVFQEIFWVNDTASEKKRKKIEKIQISHRHNMMVVVVGLRTNEIESWSRSAGGWKSSSARCGSRRWSNASLFFRWIFLRSSPRRCDSHDGWAQVKTKVTKQKQRKKETSFFFVKENPIV